MVVKSMSTRYHFWMVIRCDRCTDHFVILPCASSGKLDEELEALSCKTLTPNSRAMCPACGVLPFQLAYSIWDQVNHILTELFASRLFSNQIAHIFNRLGCDDRCLLKCKSSNSLISIIAMMVITKHFLTSRSWDFSLELWKNDWKIWKFRKKIQFNPDSFRHEN